jgi:hypothetical protein
MDSDSNAPFQQARSEFAELAKFTIKDLIIAITNLEDHILMQPFVDMEKRGNREPYQDFRRAFNDLYLLTNNTLRDSTLKTAVNMWLNATLYKAQTKNEDFAVGIDFAKQYLTQMYAVGLLDLNVSEPVDFPFEDIIRDIAAEKARDEAMKADILRRTLAATKPLTYGDTSDIPVDVDKLVGLSSTEDDGFDMFDADSKLVASKIETVEKIDDDNS